MKKQQPYHYKIILDFTIKEPYQADKILKLMNEASEVLAAALQTPIDAQLVAIVKK